MKPVREGGSTGLPPVWEQLQFLLGSKPQVLVSSSIVTAPQPAPAIHQLLSEEALKTRHYRGSVCQQDPRVAINLTAGVTRRATPGAGMLARQTTR